MVIYLFRDKNNDDIFAFSTDVTGLSIPPAAATTEWMFIEALDTLKFPEPWDIGDFQYVSTTCKRTAFIFSKVSSSSPPPWDGRSRPDLFVTEAGFRFCARKNRSPRPCRSGTASNLSVAGSSRRNGLRSIFWPLWASAFHRSFGRPYRPCMNSMSQRQP
jgi:hypothetical protein